MTTQTQPDSVACAPAHTGTVVVATRQRFAHQAACTCGHLRPRRRVLRAAAVIDALAHASQFGCVPAVPLTGYRISLT